MSNYLLVLDLAQVQRDNAEQLHLAWMSIFAALDQYREGKLNKKQVMDFLRAACFDKDQQGFYLAADAYQQAIYLLDKA